MKIQLEEEYYGKYECELIAIFDLTKEFIETEKANQEFRKFCHSYNIVELPNKLDSLGNYTFGVFSPNDDLNLDWYANNKECGYQKAIKLSGNSPVRSLPISSSKKKWLKLLNKYPTIKVTREFKNLDELKNYYLNEYGISNTDVNHTVLKDNECILDLVNDVSVKKVTKLS